MVIVNKDEVISKFIVEREGMILKKSIREFSLQIGDRASLLDTTHPKIAEKI